ncbi:hypothetical protein [Flavobacterium gelatinilyticum]|uniref:hypothetical protein n=1 Tax=Flavobacterium gelatinilyticum TaxID=3003260 RepID=UPI0024804029|nr:hypothetical protein [Flavobacterium gelatinilyticum]
MQLRQLSNLIFRVLGFFLIYSLLFKYTIGAAFDINKDNITNIFSVFSLDWMIVFYSCFFFIVLIKNVNILSYIFYRKNYVVELNKLNQYLILKVIFVTFSLFRLTILFFTSPEINFWDKLLSTVSIIFLVLILLHKIIIQFIIRSINSYSKIQSNYIFIFSMIPILLYFYFFWDYGYGTGSLNPFEFMLRLIVLLITFSSPLVFRLLIQKGTLIRNYHFTFILFFWILFLYNLQKFLFKLPTYEINNNMYFIKNFTFHVILPLVFLSLHSIFARIKTISTLRFALLILGILLVFCPVIRYLNGTSYAMHLYLISGIIILILSQKTSFLDKKLEKLKFKKEIRPIEPSLQNGSSFLFMGLLFLTISNYFAVFSDKTLFFKEGIFLTITVVQLIFFGKIVLNNKLRINNLNGFITTSITFFLTLIFYHYYLWYLSALIFNVNLLFTTDTVYFIILLLMILFSSYITKLIKIVLPNSYFEKFS